METMKRALSKESQSFLENLRLYLISNGKDDEEINAIVEELEDHLMEAESRGKTVDDIIGRSPKQYMKQLSDEMVTNKREWFKHILMIIVGFTAFSILTDAINGHISYSIMEIIGSIIICLVSIFSIRKAFQYVSTTNFLSIKKEFTLYTIIGLLPIILFIGLTYLDRLVKTPIFYFSDMGTIMIVVLSIGILIGMSLWAKTWVVFIMLALLIIPDFIIDHIDVQPGIKLVLSTLITFGGITIYLMFNHKKMQKQV